MIAYHVWFDLKPGVRDVEFSDAAAKYLGHLREAGQIASFRMTRRALGLGPPLFPEWFLTIDFENFAQIDRCFGNVASRAEPIESLHHAVNSQVTNLSFALYRDFPDPTRRRGEEKF
jgi:hypothetical protein